jgi:hypothetical protein
MKDGLEIKARRRVATYIKRHPDSWDVRDFVLEAVWNRFKTGDQSYYTDCGLEQLVAAERNRRELVKKAEQQIRSERAKTGYQYHGLAIGMMIAGESRADLRGLIVGLAGIEDEVVEAQPAAITAGQENDGGKTE